MTTTRPSSPEPPRTPANPSPAAAIRGSFPASAPPSPRAAPRSSDLERTVEVVRGAARSLTRSSLPQMAAALSYRTIFGLVPVLVVGLVVVGSFSSPEDIGALVRQIVSYAGLSDIEINERGEIAPNAPDALPDSIFTFGLGPLPLLTPPRDTDSSDPADPASPRAPPDPAPASTSGAPSADPSTPPGSAAPAPPASDASTPDAPDAAPAAARLDTLVTDLVLRARGLRLQALGLAGLLMLLYAAISMLVEVERAFNQVYRVPAGRSWARRITQYWTLLTLGTILLFTTFYVGEKFKSWAADVGESTGLMGRGPVALAVIGYSVTVVISTLLLLLAYLTVPNTKVRWRPALVGAFVAAVLWEAGKWGFTQYLRYSAAYERIYGSIALIPLFLLWVYLTWLIVLLGLQVAHRLQNPRTSPAEPTRLPVEPAFFDPALVLVLLADAARRFRQGLHADAASLSASSGLPESLTRLALARLAAAGFLHRVADADDEHTFALSRPPEQIDAADALRVLQSLAARQPDDAPEPPLLADLNARRADALRGRSLADLVPLARAPAPAAPPRAPEPAPTRQPTLSA